MHEGVECPIRIEYESRSIDAFQLVEFAQRSDELPLLFTNEFGESRHIVFRPNSGILTINERRYVLAAKPNGSFFLLPQNSDRCEWAIREKREAGGTRTAEYYSDFLDGKWRYVELALIADHSVYEKYNKNATEVHERLSTLANFINTLYQPLNIRVVLVWADVWTESNPIEVLSNSDQTLSSFLEFRKRLIRPHPHDNAHLLTNIHFDNSIVGKAYKGTMCSFDFSGGVDNDHNDAAAFVAATIAHEMGHNFGMEHDTSYTDCKCPARGCIMAPSTGTVAPTYWSDCSLRYLQHSLKRGADYCLRNAPDGAFGGARCGNGLLEAGEECDCGLPSVCTNKCCNAATCKLVEGAQCASGECCHLDTCQVKQATTLCREATDSCDLPEYCDGQMEHCPADFFVQDGLRCPDHPTDFCYDGKCGNRDEQCRFIWGPTGTNAARQCYELNMHGSSAGNCGYDQIANEFATCERRDVECGRLHCSHENEKLAFGDPSTVYTAYTGLRLSDGQDVACRVIWTKLIGNKKQPDPGMVPDGASCAADRMCVDAKCENRTEKVKLAPKCDPESCNDAGICNNMGNCHCRPGYGGISCAIPGPGGSVNSGPASEGNVIHVGYVVFWLLFISAVAFVIASVFVKRKRNIWLHKQIWQHLKKVLKLQRLLVPIRKAPPPPSPPIGTAELNAIWGDSPADALQRCRRPSPPAFSPPIIPSASITPTHTQVNVSRNASIRPKNAPPKIPKRPDTDAMSALYAERGDELRYAVPPADDYRPQASKIVRSESSTSRPVKPPPPPPHKLTHYDQASASFATHRSVSNCSEESKSGSGKKKSKPRPPAKPSVVAKPSVKNIAARFDPNSSQHSANFV
ncbi:Disintegrin and metalloproteinase domain-containing protein 12 [Toxocara canis]|uniref:Disintegrin and metalloproteinase domain-containing protein 12 n=1 Tax=Toxocara canis TaxID=6265 RepID=A0A0B2UJJ2_TOXCA|nr:Disintegrin and metalloproteinase domain-containing protein 12 [Toxocara canis]